MEPTGVVNGEKATWLLATVSEGRPTRNGRALFREVTREARLIDDEAAQALADGAKRQSQKPEGDPTPAPGPAVNHAAA